MTPLKILFIEIGHEIFSLAILSLPLIKVRQLSVAAKMMFTEYCLMANEVKLPRQSVVSITVLA